MHCSSCLLACLAPLFQCLESRWLKPLPILQCAEIAEHLAGDMARENLKGKTLTLKLKTTAFEVRTRAHSLPQHISTAAEIEAVALRLLKAEVPIEIRLMGMRMSHFLEVRKEAGQQSIAAFVKQEGSHPDRGMMVLRHVQCIWLHVPGDVEEGLLSLLSLMACSSDQDGPLQCKLYRKAGDVFI